MEPLSYLMLASPSILGGLTQLFAGEPKPTPYMNELGKLSKMFKEQYDLADQDALATNSAKARLRMVQEANKEQEKRMNNVAGRMGMTDEAKLSGLDDLNGNIQEASNQIIANNFNEKSQMLSGFLNSAGMLEQLRQGQIGQRQNRISSIFQPMSQAIGSYTQAGLLGGNSSASPTL